MPEKLITAASEWWDAIAQAALFAIIGVLTALGLEGETRWLIEAREQDGAIQIAQRSIS